jgi:hypothetical protein
MNILMKGRDHRVGELVQQVNDVKFLKASPKPWRQFLCYQYSKEKCVPEGCKTKFVGYLSAKLHGVTSQNSVMSISNPPELQVSQIGNRITDEEEGAI